MIGKSSKSHQPFHRLPRLLILRFLLPCDVVSLDCSGPASGNVLGFKRCKWTQAWQARSRNWLLSPASSCWICGKSFTTEPHHPEFAGSCWSLFSLTECRSTPTEVSSPRRAPSSAGLPEISKNRQGQPG